MLLIRRLYVYVICAISLIVLAVGVINLLELAALQLWEGLTGSRLIEESGDEIRRQVSFYLALVGVSLPIWLIHWYLAERWVQQKGAGSDRWSGVRALYLALVLGVSLIYLATNFYTLIDATFSDLMGLRVSVSSRALFSAAMTLLVTSLVWAGHAWIRDRDTRRTRGSGAGVWPVRAYLYAALFAGGVVLVIGLTGVIELALDVLTDISDANFSLSWWGDRLADPLTMIIVGGLIWSGHWWYSLRLIRDTGWRGESERGSTLRRAYFLLAVAVGVVITLLALCASLTELLRLPMGVEVSSGSDPFWMRVIRPLLMVLPLALVWWFHHKRSLLEADALADREQQLSVRRVHRYLVAFIALGYAAAGFGYLAGVTIEFAVDVARLIDTDPQWLPDEFSQFTAVALVGSAIWFRYWARTQQHVAASSTEERAATSRRAYLYLVLAASTLGLLVVIAYILYQLLQLLLGVRDSTGLASDISALSGVTFVGTSLLIYHLRTLLTDLRELPPEGVPAVPVEPEPTPPVPASLSFTLTGADAATLNRVLEDLRLRLPANVDLTEATGYLQAEDSIQRPLAVDEAESKVEAKRIFS